MSKYTFRIKFIINPTGKVDIGSNSYKIALSDHDVSTDVISNEGNQISKSHEIVFMSSGWKAEEEAQFIGEKYLNALIVAFASAGIGANFGTRSPKGAGFSKDILESLSNKGLPVVNDSLGLIVYKSYPKPRFASSTTAIAFTKISSKKFEDTLNIALTNIRTLKENEKLALETFHASSFLSSYDARFLLLFISVEALIPNSSLKKKSLKSAGKEFVIDVLRAKNYMELTAPEFFLHCYKLRNKIVHGDPPLPSRDEVSSTVVYLQKIVSDLVSILILGINKSS